MKIKGAIAAGHEDTARAAAVILREGGNAFDAVLAAMLTTCVAEPVLASLGGGGFLMARSRERSNEIQLYDFFVQTPKRKRNPEECDFFPIVADFGEAQQEFHIGLGSMATPGTVMGLFEAHRDLGSIPMTDVAAPAIALAAKGVRINALQAYIIGVVEKIYSSNDTCLAAYGGKTGEKKLLGEGDLYLCSDFADVLGAISREGADLFYRGEIATRLAADCRERGGYLSRADLEGYRIERRRPLRLMYRGQRLSTNPAPSTGGILIGFALSLLESRKLGAMRFGDEAHLTLLAEVMDLTNRARIESGLGESEVAAAAERLLDPAFLETYRNHIRGHPLAPRGTTHISVIDGAGNAAALTLSNGEGSAYIVPGTGIMINNMLGEEDINPGGFHRWREDVRMSSMMSPSLLENPDGAITALGSGGSNRIRTAILQVLIDLIDFSMPLEAAVHSPRMHVEGGLFSIENGFGESEMQALAQGHPDIRHWSDRNMFFGGVHAARFDPRTGAFEGVGDPRRGGAALNL